tara:strand:+ start:592 stop:786 length:195 start_codon:yes stop_codon:yes gene_type:complete
MVWVPILMRRTGLVGQVQVRLRRGHGRTRRKGRTRRNGMMRRSRTARRAGLERRNGAERGRRRP